MNHHLMEYIIVRCLDSIVLFFISIVIAGFAILVISVIKIYDMYNYCNDLFRRLKMKRLCLSPSSRSQDMAWAESIIAVEKGVTNKMLQVLQKEPDLIFTADAAGETVVHLLAKAGLGDVITIFTCSLIMEIVGKCRMKRVLLKKNADGDTPLHLALEMKNQQLAYWLVVVDYEAAFEYNNYEVRPYELIGEAGYSNVLQKIPVISLQGGFADIEMALVRESFPKWNEPIPKCARKAFLRASKGIISPKEIQLYIDEYGGNMLHWAANYDRLDLMQLLEQFVDNSILASLALEKNIGGDLPLHLTDDEATALYLVEVEPKAAFFLNRKGNSFVYLAIQQGCSNLVSEIFQRMPGSKIGSSLKQNLLTKKASVANAAIGCGNPGIMETITKELPDSIDSLNEQGWRPLSYAAYNGYLFGLGFYLTRFPDYITKYDTDGSLPIHKAVGGGLVDIVHHLLSSYPATMYHLDNKGQSILHIAVRYGKTDVFSYLNKKKEVKEIFHLKDNKGRTFVDLFKQLQQSAC